jgi:hypothetical protein
MLRSSDRASARDENPRRAPTGVGVLRRRRFKHNLLLEEMLGEEAKNCARNRGGFRLPIGETRTMTRASWPFVDEG